MEVGTGGDRSLQHEPQSVSGLSGEGGLDLSQPRGPKGVWSMLKAPEGPARLSAGPQARGNAFLAPLSSSG